MGVTSPCLKFILAHWGRCVHTNGMYLGNASYGLQSQGKVGLVLVGLVPSSLLAPVRKGLVKRVALPCPGGSYMNYMYQSACSKVVT